MFLIANGLSLSTLHVAKKNTGEVYRDCNYGRILHIDKLCPFCYIM